MRISWSRSHVLEVAVALSALLCLALVARRFRRSRSTGPTGPGTSSFATGLADRLVAVGTVDHRSARIWVRSDHTGSHRIELTDPRGVVTAGTFEVPADPLQDGTAVVRWPEDVGAADLEPLTRYRFRVLRADGERVGAGGFVTAPLGEADAPDTFSVAIASCHEPFDDRGDLQPASMHLLDVLLDAFEEHDARLLLLLGDQVYTDLPPSHSLFDPVGFARVGPPGRADVLSCSRPEVRRLLQRRYRSFWNVPSLCRLQASLPTACMLDDHELCDNFGSHPDHAGEAWRAFREGALDAFMDYQGLRTHDRTMARSTGFAHRHAWGPLAALVLDLRSQRVADGHRVRVLGEAQWSLLERFLAEEADRPVLLLGLSVPLLHAPEWLVTAAAAAAVAGSAVHDRWSHPAVKPDRDRLIHILRRHRQQHPGQQVVLVSGDVHVGTAARLEWDGAPPVLQLVSSAVSNLEQRIVRLASAALPWTGATLTTEDGIGGEAHLIEGIPEHDANPFTGLNAGLVTLRRTEVGWSVRLRLVSHDDGDPPRARVVYDSGELLPNATGAARPTGDTSMKEEVR